MSVKRNENPMRGNPQFPSTRAGIPNEEKETTRYNFALSISQAQSWDDLRGEVHFEVGVVVFSADDVNTKLFETTKSISSCVLTSVVILNEPAVSADRDRASQGWIERNRLAVTDDECDYQNLSVGWGQDGFDALLKKEVDAVFIIVPPGLQKDYVLAALQHGKHVLLDDPISTKLPEFTEQLDMAKKHGKFIQFSTMFVHQYRMRRVIERAIRDEAFGKINRIVGMVQLNYNDLAKVGGTSAQGPDAGVIRVVGRFCVLFSTLFYSRDGSKPYSARTEKVSTASNEEIVSAECVVKFTEGRELKFDVSYTIAATRQSIELQAFRKTAQMKDFIIEHPDGLSNFRIYDEAEVVFPDSSEVQVVRAQSIDVPGGASQDTMMWRNFVKLSGALDSQGGWNQSKDTEECRELADVAVQTKRILLALSKSWENDGREVLMDEIPHR